MWQGRNAVGGLTKLFEHFVALVQYEVFDFGGVQGLVPDERVEATGRGHDDVRAFRLVTEELGIFGDGSSTEEGRDADIGHVLGETRVLILDLEGKLSSVTEDKD